MTTRQPTTDQTEEICNSKKYLEMTARLHKKYPLDPATNDYPEEYWIEFNDEYDKLVEEYLRTK